jgi:hypothetical protein
VDLQRVALELAAGEGFDAQGAGVALEGSRAVDGQRDRQDDHKAGRGQAARALGHTRHVPQRSQLDEGAYAHTCSSKNEQVGCCLRTPALKHWTIVYERWLTAFRLQITLECISCSAMVWTRR